MTCNAVELPPNKSVPPERPLFYFAEGNKTETQLVMLLRKCEAMHALKH